VNQEAFQLFSAILALVVLVGGLGTFVALAFESRMTWTSAWLTQVRASGLWIICMITTGAMVGSLYFSEKVGFAPCKLCWYQRIGIFSIAIISFVAALRNDKNIARYTIVLAPIGLVVSTYHYLLEWFPTLETNVCSLDVPCTAVWFRELGFVTLCFMAGCAFITVIAVSLAIMREEKIDSTSTNQEN
jgi:disulfide bond formation protein DsbB